MTLFVQELRQNYRSMLIWLVVLIACNGLLLTSFQATAELAQSTEAFLAQYPQEFIQALNLDVLEMTDVLHFYASRSYLLTAILGSAFAGILGAAMLTKEESDQTSEFLLAKPISRSNILIEKFASVIVLVTLFNGVFAISNFVLLRLVQLTDFSISSFLWLTLGTWLLHLFFACAGFFISGFTASIKTSLSLVLGSILVMYIVSLVPALQERLAFFRFLTPFSYFNTKDLVIERKIQGMYLLLFLISCAILLIITWQYYRRKDINS
ncbi:ABC transporter permease subunit [Enterococcus xiangfangensis]|uniref:ABC transporter permease subunit n=1 Tax=Enterococcus xiangfangensis TaxID=1296537 RepID=UPI0010F8DD7E|nr:ABC transporter permease subunit [Enterococcus xiangfangensis]MBM7712816.1 ABC-2 type transport system permease protein [Enterococcus xiangfangensis]